MVAGDYEWLFQDILKGNVALWAAEPCKPPILPIDDTDEAEFDGLDWLCIWTESKQREWYHFLRDTQQRRQVIEVPGRLEDALGTGYNFSHFSPVFYLNAELSNKREKRRARDEKVDEIERLNDSVVIFIGYGANYQKALDTIKEELPESLVAKLVMLVDDSDQKDAVDQAIRENSELSSKQVHVVVLPFQSLFDDVCRRKRDKALLNHLQPSVLVGEQRSDIDIAQYLDKENPIDQTFEILLHNTISEEAESNLTDKDVIEDFISKKNAPWTAIRKELTWERKLFEKEKVESWTFNKLVQNRHSDQSRVSVLKIFGERGSGLTTILQKIAFYCASRSFLTLFYRDYSESYSYDELRVFLEQVTKALGKQDPVLIIIDGTQPGALSPALLELEDRLARDGRRAVIVRGMFWSDDADSRGKESKHVESISYNEGAPISGNLSHEEVQSLLGWVKQYWGEESNFHSIESVLQSWQFEEENGEANYPLLACLYLILRDNLDNPGNIGKHIADRVLSLANEVQTSRTKPEDLRYFDSNEALQAYMEKASERKEKEVIQPDTLPDAEILKKVFLVLCVLSSLRTYTPYRVIEELTGAGSREVRRCVSFLRHHNLAKAYFDNGQSDASMSAKAVYYTSPVSVSLIHPAFGLSTLAFLQKNNENFGVTELTSHIFDVFDVEQRYPLALLLWVLPELSPREDNVEFIMSLCKRFLRYQKMPDSPYHEWVHQGRMGLLVQCLDAIPGVVAENNAYILHTKGLTRYKSMNSSAGYQQAANELNLALERVDSGLDASDDKISLQTTLGMLYRDWSRDLEGEENDPVSKHYYLEKAIGLLENALQARPGNAYASGVLVDILVGVCETLKAQNDTAAYSAKLADLIKYLQYEPHPLFRRQWGENYRAATALFNDKELEIVIDQLYQERDSMAAALKAIRILKKPGIPTDIIAKEEEPAYEEALQVLDKEIGNIKKDSFLYRILRYAVYSSIEANQHNFRERYERIYDVEIKDLTYLPAFLYDYAMLSYQVGEYQQGDAVFRELRRGRKFLMVPLERSELLDDYTGLSDGRVKVFIKKLDEERSIGYIQLKGQSGNITIDVRFQQRLFQTGKALRVGGTFSAYLQLRPAGPTAVPAK